MLNKQTQDQNLAEKTIVSPILEALFDRGAHVGHSKSRRHPKMSPFIYTTRNNVEIFDLQHTASMLKSAEDFFERLGKENKLILWVGTKPAARAHIERVAQNLAAPYVSKRWLGGLLTNFKELSKRLEYWKQLEADSQSGELEKYVKKERTVKLTELRKMGKIFGGLRPLQALPDAVVVVDPKEEHTAFEEAKKKNFPIVALLNSDCNPEGVSYPIPGNDGSSATIAFVLDRLASAYEKGKRESAANAAPAIVPAA